MVDVTDADFVCVGVSVGALSVYKDSPLICGSCIMVVLWTSVDHALFPDVIAAECSVVVGTAMTGKVSSDEPVTGLLNEIVSLGLASNLRDLICAFGGLLGGLVVSAVVGAALAVIGIDIGGLAC